MISTLYSACEYIPGTPSPMKHPEKVDMVVFRQRIRKMFMPGIEWKAESKEATRVREFLEKEMGVKIRKVRRLALSPSAEAWGPQR